MKKYTIIFSDVAKTQIARLDKTAREKIIKYLIVRICENPKSFGKALVGSH